MSKPGRQLRHPCERRPPAGLADARAVVARLDDLGVPWLAELEDRDGSLFVTAIDPDGNYVQIIQLSEEHRAATER